MGVAGCPGIPGRIKSEWVAGCYRNQWPDRPGIRTEVDNVGFDNIRDHFDDILDQAMGALGSTAANQLEDEADQEEAISLIERWFSNNASGQGTETCVLAAIWLQGLAQAPQAIRAEIATVAKPQSQM